MDWSKIYYALEKSPGCVDEGQHRKFITLALTPNVIMKSDAFYYDNNIGMEDVWFSDTELTQHSELHKYALLQSKFWWNKYDLGDYPIIPSAKQLVMEKYPYFTQEICNLIEKSEKFYNYKY